MSKNEKKKGRAGAFIGGTFFGFLLCLGAIVGLGCFTYFKVSSNWINKTFKVDINLGSEQINDKTLSDLFADINGIIKNKDTYTLNDLNNDFGIKISDEIVGIKITDLKDVPFDELSTAIQNKFGSISADELRNVSGMNLATEMGNVLSKSNTYYFNAEDSKLYKSFDGLNYSNPVNFDYKVNSDKTVITTKEHESAITAGKVDIELWYLPITSALGDFTKNLGDNITLGELQSQYGVSLPTFLQAGNGQKNENKTVNDLSNMINELYVGEILNYTVDDTNPEDIKVQDNGVDVTGIIGKLSTIKISNLETQINQKIKTITLTEIYGAKPENGILSIIEGDPTVEELPNAIKNSIVNAKLNDLVSAEVISVNSSSALNGEVDHDNDGIKTKVGELTVNEFLNYCLDNINSLTSI